MSGSSKTADNETQPVQVFVRIRPFLQNESPVSCLDTPTSKDVVVKHTQQKNFSFDEVFDLKSTQSKVYNSIVKPYVSDIISGYNCTVIAYGPSVTGKTYTMNGVIPNIQTSQDSINTALPEECGMIPRFVSDLFKELEQMKIQYEVGCTYYEVNNEELFDLLLVSGDSTHLRIYEDRRNKGAVWVEGLHEIAVTNQTEVFNLLRKARTERIKNGKPFCHTIFTLYLHIHKTDVVGEEHKIIGKICMVDLASTDTCSRSAVDRSVRDNCGANQTLLTLWRVVKALSGQDSHVPFRESKLTRILQDSLGGKSKTSIIATIAPLTSSTDDILSTLELAQKARTIFNKPEVNKKVPHMKLLAFYMNENVRLRKDLEASRTRTGVYLSEEDIEKMATENKTQNETVAQLRLLMSNLESSKKEGTLQKEELCKYVKNTCTDLLEHLNDFDKLCEEKAQTIQLLGTQQTELYNKSSPILSNCINKIDARSSASNIDMCLDKATESLNSRSEASAPVLDFEENWDFDWDDVEGCSKPDGCVACQISAEVWSKFDESIDDSPFVDNSIIKKAKQAYTDLDSKISAQQDHIRSMKESFLEQTKTTYETLRASVMGVKNEIRHCKSNCEHLRNSTNINMSNVKEELQKYASSSLDSLQLANSIVSEVADPTRNSDSIYLAKHIEKNEGNEIGVQQLSQVVQATSVSDNERFIENSFKACIDQNCSSLNKSIENTYNTILEEHVIVEEFSKDVSDFSQRSMLYNSSILEKAAQLQSTIKNQKFEEVKHAGDTPPHTHHQFPFNLKDLTPKEKALQSFREGHRLINAPDENESAAKNGSNCSEPTGAMEQEVRI